LNRIYKNGDRVQIALYGHVQTLLTGTIVGSVSFDAINRLWIIEPDEQIGEFKCITQFDSFLRPIGSNEPFRCEVNEKV
jgi:hypothetical protein